MEKMTPKILIIGAGITGSLCASGIRNVLSSASVTVWDKARGAGGRMSTTRTDTGNFADLGAQYITVSPESANLYNLEYSDLVGNSILTPLTCQVDGLRSFPEGTKHYVAPKGMSSVVKHFLGTTPVTFTRHVSSLSVKNGKCQVETQDGASELFDIVISTMPVNQFLALSCDIPYARPNLEKVEYSSRFVLNWFYDRPIQPPNDWAVKYLNDDVFRYACWDNHKRNQPEENASLVFHTSVDFGKTHQSRKREELEGELNERAKRLFPEWPAPTSIKCHKWLYSQVVKPAKERGCLKISENPRVILAGDAFTASNLTGCIESARAAVQAAYRTL